MMKYFMNIPVHTRVFNVVQGPETLAVGSRCGLKLFLLPYILYSCSFSLSLKTANDTD